MQLTEHFSLEEFVFSRIAEQRGIDNTPPAGVVANLQKLCEQVLEPARRQLDAPITVSSGYRCQALNEAVGGAKKSQHLLGQAADIVVDEASMMTLFQIIKRRGNFDQLLFEHSGDTKWIHVSYNFGHNRRQSNDNYKA